MLFNTLQYGVFLALVLLLLRLMPAGGRRPLLLAASFAFYALWRPVYLLLLLADLIVNYVLLKKIVESPSRKAYLALSIIFTLGVLAGFKYAAFFAEALAPVLGVGVLDVPAFFLPLGLSFYSFQIIALAVDTYRDHREPPPSFSRYALFISFFPQLIAGPILRGREMLPQLAAGGVHTADRNRRGAWLLLAGLAKKVIFADFLLAGFVDDAFAYPQVGGAAYHLIVAYSFAFQIYFDFSGYVDMARGSALLLGFEIPSNFREPYLARNPAEFWQRWHITLSNWLRDYLYIPLGGNRGGSQRTSFNLFMTMTLGGLWHGAAWTFVVWGALHGVVLVLHRMVGGAAGDIRRPLVLRDAPKIAATFTVVALLLAIFRAPSLAVAGEFFAGFANLDFLTGWPLVQTAIVALCIVSHLVEHWLRPRLRELRNLLSSRAWGPVVEGAVGGILLGLSYALAGAGGEFIYFQF